MNGRLFAKNETDPIKPYARLGLIVLTLWQSNLIKTNQLIISGFVFSFIYFISQNSEIIWSAFSSK